MKWRAAGPTRRKRSVRLRAWNGQSRGSGWRTGEAVHWTSSPTCVVHRIRSSGSSARISRSRTTEPTTASSRPPAVAEGRDDLRRPARAEFRVEPGPRANDGRRTRGDHLDVDQQRAQVVGDRRGPLLALARQPVGGEDRGRGPRDVRRLRARRPRSGSRPRRPGRPAPARPARRRTGRPAASPPADRPSSASRTRHCRLELGQDDVGELGLGDQPGRHRRRERDPRARPTRRHEDRQPGRLERRLPGVRQLPSAEVRARRPSARARGASAGAAGRRRARRSPSAARVAVGASTSASLRPHGRARAVGRRGSCEPAGPLGSHAPSAPVRQRRRRPGRIAVRAAVPARRGPHRRGDRRRPRAVDGPRQHPAVHPRPAVRLPARPAGPLARPARPAADVRDPHRLRRRDRPVHRVPGADADPARQRDHPVHRRLPEARREPRPPAPASRRVLRAPPDPDRGPRVDRQPDRRDRPGRRRVAAAAAPTCRS